MIGKETHLFFIHVSSYHSRFKVDMSKTSTGNCEEMQIRSLQICIHIPWFDSLRSIRLQFLTSLKSFVKLNGWEIQDFESPLSFKHRNRVKLLSATNISCTLSIKLFDNFRLIRIPSESVNISEIYLNSQTILLE